MAQTSIAVSARSTSSVIDVYRDFPATAQLIYMDVAARGVISRTVYAALNTHLDGRMLGSAESDNYTLMPAARRFDLGNYNFLGCAAADASMAQSLTYDSQNIERHALSLSHRLAQGFLDLDLPVCGGARGPHLAHMVAVGELGSSHYGTEDEGFNQLYTFLTDHDVRLSIRCGVLRFSLHV